MIALATQKFVYQVAWDAKQHHDRRATKMRVRDTPRCCCALAARSAAGFASSSRRPSRAREQKRVALKMDDLEESLRDNGINIRKPVYFAEPR